MNSVLNINIRVAAEQARRAVREVDAEIRKVQKTGAQGIDTGSATKGLRGFMQSIDTSKLNAFSKELQWTGRQLEFAFTLPLVAAGAAATQWNLDNQQAMTSLRKVYGDVGEDQAKLRRETDLLGQTFEVLSSRFGVQQSEVIKIGAAWAQAGSAGVALAKGTRTTLEMMILGGQSAEKATEGLITMQAAYRLSADQLRDAIADLNSVENATAIDMQGLIDVFQRAGGTAASAGISIEQLAAYAAAIVPAGASATQAGNGLRSMISRLMAPTNQTAELLREMGIEVNSFAWQSQNGAQRIETMAKEFDKLSDAQKRVVASNAAGAWQVNRFDLLMQQVNQTLKEGAGSNNFYAKALAATADQQKSNNTLNRELRTQLESDPQMYKMLTTSLRNYLTRAVQPLLPTLIIFLSQITKLAKAFNDLSPETRNLVLMMLALAAASGPVVRYIGAIGLALDTMGRFSGFAGKMLGEKGLGGGLKWIGKNGIKAFGYLARGPELVIKGLMRLLLRNKVITAAFSTDHQVSATKTAVTWDAAMAKVEADNLTAAKRAAATWQAEAGAVSRNAAQTAVAWDAALTKIETDNAIAAARSAAVWNGYTATQAANAAKASATWDAALLGAGGIGGKNKKAAVEAEKAAAKSTGAWARFGGRIGGFFRGTWMVIDGMLLGLPGLFARALGGVGKLVVKILGPVARLIPRLFVGAFGLLRTVAVTAVRVAMMAVAALVAAFGWEVVAIGALIVAAVIGIAAAFHWLYEGGISGFVKDTAKALGQLPKVFGNVFNAIIRFLVRAIARIRDFLSYLNPFARHSPSLVDNVTNGVTAILSQYSRLKAIPSMLAGAKNALKNFSNATGPASDRMASDVLAEQRAKVTSAAPNAGGAFDALAGSINALRPQLRAIGAEVDNQSQIVDEWEQKLKQANNALDEQDAILDKLKNTAESYKDQLDAAQERLDNFTKTPIAGLRAMEDQIFNNEMAQKRLRLEMLKLGGDDAIQKAADQMALLQGAIERTQGTANDLRLAGAGSDILGPLGDQVAAMKAARSGLANNPAVGAIGELQKQLDELEAEAERLDLEKALQFDPLQRQIEQVSDRIEEMPFDQLMANIIASQAEVDGLTKSWEQANAQVVAQQAVVDQATAARDEVGKRYDAEKDKLDELQDAYSEVEQAIRDGEAAINDFVSAVEDAQRRAKQAADDTLAAVEQFRAGEGANFDDVTGAGGLGREGGEKELEEYLRKQQEELDKAFGDIGGNMDIFKPIKDAWKKAWKWIQDETGPYIEPVKQKVKEGVAWLGFEWGKFSAKAKEVWQDFKNAPGDAWDWVRDNVFTPISDWINNNILPVWDSFKNGVKGAWDEIVSAAQAAWDWVRDNVFQPIWDFINNYLVPIWTLFQAIVVIVFAAIVVAAATAWNWVRDNVFDPIRKWIDETVIPAWNRFKDKVGEVWDWLKDKADKAWNWVKDNVFEPIRKWIDETVIPAWNRMKGSIGDAFGWLKDKAETAWSWVRDNVFDPIRKWIDDTIIPAWNRLKEGVKGVWEGIASAASSAFTGIKESIKEGINWVIDRFNDLADKINGIPDIEGPGVSIGIPDVKKMPRLAAGGVVGTVDPSGGLYKDVRAIIGEGSNVYPEFVIPSDPKYRARARALLKQANIQLLESGGSVGKTATTSLFYRGGDDPKPGGTVNHFHGDLVFPNVKSGDDAEDFISNLEKLAG